MAEDLNASIRITAFDAFTGPVEGMKRALTTLGTAAMSLKSVNFAGVSNSTARVGMAMDNLRGSVMGVKSALASIAISGAGFALFKKELLDPAVGFERFTAQLTAVEGSSTKAQKSMAWIEKFAIDTPFDLDESTRAFESLRVKGIEPTHGVMQAIGEAATGMGKPLEQATDAINQALKGRMMGLGDFGILGHDAGAKLQFAYVDAAGKKRVREANKSDRQMVANTLAAIFNDKFRGAMSLFDKTYAGMIENLGDSWAEFRLAIMRSGLFDYIKSNMGELLEWVRKITKSGQLDLWAQNISDAFISAFEFIKKEGPRIGAVVMGLANAANFAAQMFGGWGNVLETVMVYKLARVGFALGGVGLETVSWVGSVVKLGGAIGEKLVPTLGLQISSLSDLKVALGLVASAGWAAVAPWAPLIAGLALVAAGSYGLYKLLDPLKQLREMKSYSSQEDYNVKNGMTPEGIPLALAAPGNGPRSNIVPALLQRPGLLDSPQSSGGAPAKKSAFAPRDDGRIRGEMTVNITTAAGLAATVSNVTGANLDINAIYNGLTTSTP